VIVADPAVWQSAVFGEPIDMASRMAKAAGSPWNRRLCMDHSPEKSDKSG
jgi:hypothetical protein